ncbi:unnamed protein product [Ectocarpus sp. CCAP 1310/34]|nr:unnamed protein product [Ectocarpus sp. CCAP 1310/34]
MRGVPATERQHHIDVEGKRSFTSQNIKDEDGKVLRNPTFIRQRWARWSHKLLNTKSPTIDLHAADKAKRWPTCVPLDDIPSLLEIEEAVREMANRKAVGPDDLPAELIKLFLDGDQGLLREFHAIVVDVWQTGDVPQQEAEASAKRQRARQAEAESTAISGPTRKRAGEAAVGGKKRRPGTAVEASRAAEAALVANYVPG